MFFLYTRYVQADIRGVYTYVRNLRLSWVELSQSISVFRHIIFVFGLISCRREESTKYYAVY